MNRRRAAEPSPHTLSQGGAGRALSVPSRFILYTVLGGATFGMLQFGEVIACKSLGAAPWALTILTMTMPIANFTSIWWGRILVGTDQRRTLRIAGLLGASVLASGVLLGKVAHLIVMYFLYYLCVALLIPAENRVLQQHIPASRTGRLMGTASGIRMVVGALVAAGAGAYLEAVAFGYRHLYLAASLTALSAFLLLGTVPTGTTNGEGPDRLGWRFLLGPLKKAAALLKRRPDYFRFEAAFMLYGIAFMMTMPVIPLYLVEDLKLDYGPIGIARGMIFSFSQAFSIPLFGRWFDRSTPHRMAVVTFLILAAFPPLLIAAGNLQGRECFLLTSLAFAVFGVGMGGLSILWCLSSLRFAGSEDAGVYHSVHVAATGIRGVFAPFLGLAAMEVFGKSGALAASSLLWVLASAAMIAVRIWDFRSGAWRSLRSEAAPFWQRPPGAGGL